MINNDVEKAWDMNIDGGKRLVDYNWLLIIQQQKYIDRSTYPSLLPIFAANLDRQLHEEISTKNYTLYFLLLLVARYCYLLSL